MTTISLPARSEVPVNDTWDLSSLYPNEEAWEAGLRELESRIAGFAAYQGRLAESPAVLAELLQFDADTDRLAERVAIYASLRTTEDQANSAAQRNMGRFESIGSRLDQAASFIRPELLAIDDQTMERFLGSNELKPWRLALERVVRYKPYTLGAKEEQLLAMQSEMAHAASQAYTKLTDADLKFGKIKDAEGVEKELSQATLLEFLYSPDRDVRRQAFHQYYEQIQGHENTLAATLNGSVQGDVYYARARGYESALQKALFADDVPMSVYDNLIASVRKNLPSIHRYYEVRRRALQLDEIHHYDTYVPILSNQKVHRTWDEAVSLVIESLAPLGDEYCSVLESGLRGRWCDRYPNKNKHSGAFSCGSFDGDPYILMNYKPDVLNDTFTLTHEAGHSMHSYYSARSQPFQYYRYVIFVAEVASTFNEQLLTVKMMEQAESDEQRAYLINNELDSIRSTLVRQTMFAEFEKKSHELVESGEPLTVDSVKEIYGGLLRDYFGPQFALDDELSLECLRIPHFYRAFYVYKYATGLSAAIALAQRVLQGGKQELNEYLGFLRSGGSKFPLELLRDAGVDMEQSGPVDTALQRFDTLLTEFESLIGGE
ncbi:MAG: oligoendopeptidase F [Planctomycetales bacterium]|nr:oligoendopeptidase F [Planctomycetales bacterium]